MNLKKLPKKLKIRKQIYQTLGIIPLRNLFIPGLNGVAADHLSLYLRCHFFSFYVKGKKNNDSTENKIYGNLSHKKRLNDFLVSRGLQIYRRAI